MAHFAELDANGTVLRVLVVNNAKITNTAGFEEEQLGVAFLQQLFGAETHWVQTSYNGNFRKNYAGIGYTYDAERDGFIPPKPLSNDDWHLNEDTLQWELPDTVQSAV